MPKLGQGEVPQKPHVKRWEITNLVGVPDQFSHVYGPMLNFTPLPYFQRGTPPKININNFLIKNNQMVDLINSTRW
jgi:hypothetical protein